MSIPQAFVGAKAELTAISSPWERLQRIGRIAAIFADALIGTVVMIPYGLRSLRLQRGLPNYHRSNGRHQQVSIARDVKYGALPRNLMDLYVPAERPHQSGGSPVCLFCHGGVWATGEKWQYAPMAHRLAQAGVLCIVLQYSLYPQVLVPHMIAELSQALTWTLDNVEAYGGNKDKVTLLGHSAGAQMCAMALIHRATKAAQQSQKQAQNKAQASNSPEGPGQGQGLRQRSSPGGDKTAGVGAAATSVQQGGPTTHMPSVDRSSEELFADGRMPARFIGMAGVYDIAKHYEYEEGRGVHELSTMKRAVGGYANFAAQSPAVVLARTVLQRRNDEAAREAAVVAGNLEQNEAVSRAGKRARRRPALAAVTAARDSTLESTATGRPSSYYQQFALSGEAISHRIGTERSWTDMASEVSLADDTLDGSGHTPQVSPEAALRLPPTILLSSFTDTTVPWYESAEMFWMLHDCGVPAKNLVYDKVDHSAFVVHWHPQPLSPPAASPANPLVTAGQEEDDGKDLPLCCGDLLRILSEQAPVQYCVAPRS